jgi:hypothetical protein
MRIPALVSTFRRPPPGCADPRSCYQVTLVAAEPVELTEHRFMEKNIGCKKMRQAKRTHRGIRAGMVVLSQWCWFLLEGRGLIQKIRPGPADQRRTRPSNCRTGPTVSAASRPRRAHAQFRVSLPPGNQSGRDRVRWAGRQISNRRRAMSLPPPRRRIDTGKVPKAPMSTGERAKRAPFLRRTVTCAVPAIWLVCVRFVRPSFGRLTPTAPTVDPTA